MATSKSWELHPLQGSYASIMLKSQLLRRPRRPSKAIDLSGQTAIVTGANTGLGREAASQLLSHGLSRLILAVRTAAKGEAAAAEFRKAHPQATIEVWLLEMASYPSIQAFAARAAGLDRLDLAILNAAVFGFDFEKTAGTGHDTVTQVNYLSTVLLAVLLLPTLAQTTPQTTPAGKTGPGRLTIVNSSVALSSEHAWAGARPILGAFDDPAGWPMAPMERYASSKLLGQLFFGQLVAHLPPADKVVVNIVDPGYVRGTGLHVAVPGLASAVLGASKTLIGRSVATGASTYLDAAVVHGPQSHGCYLSDWAIKPFAGLLYTPEGKAAAEALWNETLSELRFADIVGVLESIK